MAETRVVVGTKERTARRRGHGVTGLAQGYVRDEEVEPLSEDWV